MEIQVLFQALLASRLLLFHWPKRVTAMPRVSVGGCYPRANEETKARGGQGHPLVNIRAVRILRPGSLTWGL